MKLTLLVVLTFRLVALQTASSGSRDFVLRCAVCHGDNGSGTDRGPALVNNRHLRQRTKGEISSVIRNGLAPGMPAFALPDEEVQSLAEFVAGFNAPASEVKLEGDAAQGERFFFSKGGCSNCHMVNGRGTANGPDLSEIGRLSTLAELQRSLMDPSAQISPGYGTGSVRLRNGTTLRGFIRNQGAHDLQLQTSDGHIHPLADTEYESVVREKQSAMPPLGADETECRDLVKYLATLDVPRPGAHAETGKIPQSAIDSIIQPKPGDWPTYHGSLSGNRYSALSQMNTSTVKHLALQWNATLPFAGLETTPLVSDGVMYVTGPNQVYALDGRSGREIWHNSRPRNLTGIAADASKGANRGAALLGDRIFFTTDNAHLICLHRLTGALLWDVAMPDQPGSYGATSAPLVAGNLVVSGVAGGDEGIRGFIDAYDPASGKRVWRFWTVPKPGEPGAETWHGNAILQGGGSTWLTGSYDAAEGILYWGTGNPYPDTDGEDRKGDNLYTDCILALELRTGKLLWHYQVTPHDLHDWDATEPIVLVDANFQGRARKLLLQANRNGFFYVLDREHGDLLLAKPFVKKLNWASGVGADGRPVLLPANETSTKDTKTCPAVRGATNWYSTAFNPVTKLYYVMTVEDCSLYHRAQNGGFGFLNERFDPALKFLRAINIETGKTAWEIEQIGSAQQNYSGVLSTAGGLVFYGESSGGFAAVDAASGRSLWHFEAGQPWKASPMTYAINGQQFVAIASGPNILSFSLSNP